MTQEDKAKRYDEALHKAKRIINVCVDDNTECRSMIACIQVLFPELKEEPVSEDLKEAIDTYLATYFGSEKEKQEHPFLKKMAIYFANWQKEQMMAKAKSGTVQKDNQVILDNGTYIDLDPSMQLKPSFVGLKEGDKIKVIIIKED